MEFHISDKMKSLKPSAIREIFKYAVDPEVISLAAGDPAPESLPTEEIKELLTTLLDENPKALLYSQSEGHPPFRRLIKDFVKQRYQIGQDFDDLLVTTGAQQGIDLVTKVLCNEGDTIICENPSFIGALNTFRSYGVNLVGVDLEEDGISLAGLEKALQENPDTRIIYVIPNFQNPTGITMSLEKRKGVYQLAKDYGAVILEDNPYGDLRFQGEDIPTIKSMDTEDIVVYIGSFSKILSSGMRVGYCIAPAELMSKIVVAKQCTDVHTSMLGQLVCYDFLRKYDIDQHIKTLQKVYKDKCLHMLAELDRTLPKEVGFTKPEGGLFVWLTLPEYIDSDTFAKKLVQEQKICVVPGSAFQIKAGEPSSCIRMNFSMPSKENITTGVERTAKLLQTYIDEHTKQ